MQLLKEIAKSKYNKSSADSLSVLACLPPRSEEQKSTVAHDPSALSLFLAFARTPLYRSSFPLESGGTRSVTVSSRHRSLWPSRRSSRGRKWTAERRQMRRARQRLRAPSPSRTPAMVSIWSGMSSMWGPCEIWEGKHRKQSWTTCGLGCALVSSPLERRPMERSRATILSW